MKRGFAIALPVLLLLPCAGAARAEGDPYADTLKVFKNAGESGQFFEKAYGYALFPKIGKGGAGVGGARGKGRVYAAGKYHKGMAVFTVAKGGLMYEASLGGQKFKYTPKK